MIITMFKPLCMLIFLLLLSISISLSASYEYTVINTQQKAKKIVQQLKPLFTEQAQFSAKNHQLIIKASPDVTKEIKYLLKQIDRPLKNFIIQVANKKTMNQLLQSTSTSTQDKPKGGLTDMVKSVFQSGAGTTRITSTQRNADKRANAIFQAQVVEDDWVTILIGKEIPYHTIEYQTNSSPLKIQNKASWAQTQYKQLNDGFDAKISLKPNKQILVSLIIKNNYQDKQHHDTINTRMAETTISGALDEWIEIGKISNIKKQQQSGIEYNTNRSQAETSYFIKVNTISRP